MEEKELMKLILGLSKDPHRKSTLQLALEVARNKCGRLEDGTISYEAFCFRNNSVDSLMHGEKPNICSDEADLFTSLFLYLNCLEQIGTLFCDSTNKNGGTISNGIEKALIEFAFDLLSNEQRGALKKLRHSLAHNFGLVNYNEFRPDHKYLLIFDENKNIIHPPCHKWNGDYSDKSEDTSTKIYVFSVIRLVEQIIQNLQDLYANGKLNFNISVDEVKARFTILT